jgi:hypothetical protein
MTSPRIRLVPDRNPATRKIIAVDGEGWNIPPSDDIESANPNVAGRGWHSYVMLAAADDNGMQETLIHDNSRAEALEDQARNYGLRTVECCEFLLNLPKDAIVTGFYFSYDTTKLFADLPLQNIRELCFEDNIPQDEYDRRVRDISDKYDLTIEHVHKAHLVAPCTTVFDGYWIKYHPRKELKIYDLEAGQEWVKNRYFNEKYGRWMNTDKAEHKWKRAVIVWDVYGFFQSSFVRALKAYRCGECEPCARAREDKVGATAGLYHCGKAIWTPEDLERIESMKEQRGVFDASRQPEIVKYCIDECRYLSFLMRDLLTNIHAFGLSKYMDRYDGSGAIASAWMQREHIKDYLPAREMTDVFGEFTLAGLPEFVALSGYFGGRFEISEMGYMGTLYGYDVNSAYPAVSVSLPCLAHGRFRRVSEYVPGKFGVYLVGSHTSGRWAPFPFRTNESPGIDGIARDAIYYAHGGRRWIWGNADPRLSEIGRAREHFGPDAIPVYDGYVWEARCDHKPFAKIFDLYQTRREFVKAGNGVEKVIKLILNSLYGKTAQSLGWHIKYVPESAIQEIPGETVQRISVQVGGKILYANRSGAIIESPPFQCFVWAGLITSGCRAMILDAIMQPGADVVSIATDGILSRTEITTLPCGAGKPLGEWDADIVTDAYLFQSGVYTYIKADGSRAYKTRGFAAKEIPADKLISAWEAGEHTVKADSGQSRFIPMKSGVNRDSPLEFIGQWVPSEHDVNFTHNRRLPIFTPDESGEVDWLTNWPLSEPHELPDDMQSAPYSPKQCWEDMAENQMPSTDADYVDS